MNNEYGWKPSAIFEAGIRKPVKWGADYAGVFFIVLDTAGPGLLYACSYDERTQV